MAEGEKGRRYWHKHGNERGTLQMTRPVECKPGKQVNKIGKHKEAKKDVHHQKTKKLQGVTLNFPQIIYL